MPDMSRRRWPSGSDLAVVCGLRIKQLREARGLSQRDLAQLLQIAKGRVTKYERGVHTPPASILVRLADIFHATIDSLLGFSVQDPRLVVCLREIEQMDEEARGQVAQALEAIVSGYRVLLARRPAEPPR